MELFTGSIGDSDYVRESQILEQQGIFTRDYTTAGVEVVSTVNVFDKGHIVILDGLKHGKQCCW